MRYDQTKVIAWTYRKGEILKPVASSVEEVEVANYIEASKRRAKAIA